MRISMKTSALIAILGASLFLSACVSTEPSCMSPQTRNLDSAITAVQSNLSSGCAAHFDRYYDDLLTIAEGNPRPENKRTFSEFLVWSTDAGLLSQRQAEDYYNRFFNVKFMSMRGDYNNCSHTCPNRQRLLIEMERELSDKERGLLLVSQDSDGYYRADQLFHEVELVLEATCTACAAAR